MDVSQIQTYLSDAGSAASWLQGMGFINLNSAHKTLVQLATSGLTIDLVANMAAQLEEILPKCADPDMAFNYLERFVAEARSPLALGALFERDPTALPALMQLFSTSRHLSDILISDCAVFELMRERKGRPVARERLIDTIVGEIEALKHEANIMKALRRFKRRETLRIAYGDIVTELPFETTALQISYLADALIQAALVAARSSVVEKYGEPFNKEQQPAKFVVLALGKLGGSELNYSSDVDLIFLYDKAGTTVHKHPISNHEFFMYLSQQLFHYLNTKTDMGACYRVDTKLRPEGKRGPIAIGRDAALRYYKGNRARTWERQAFIKARACAGDVDMGNKFLETLEPWIYQSYLTRDDISGIRNLRRRIEKQTKVQGPERWDVKKGPGGIRDIEFTVQFLQLLNGGSASAVRTGTTLKAIRKLERAGCLSHLESELLGANYVFLRRAEHLLQIMSDLQMHTLPIDPEERRKLAVRLGYGEKSAKDDRSPRLPKNARSHVRRRTSESTGSLTLGMTPIPWKRSTLTPMPKKSSNPLATFDSDYDNATSVNRQIINHLLHDAFPEKEETADEVDLVLEPNPEKERIEEVLGKYPFKDLPRTYKLLMDLATERSFFLSSRRCRLFLASIAQELLQYLAVTPDPDAALVQLGKVSDSLGGKGLLWELFSSNPPSMKLYVRLCAYAPYLCDMLTSHPGMIDGLMDGLALDRLPSQETLRATLADLCRGASNADVILHSFKNDQQLRVGAMDVLGKGDVRLATGTLADIADVCLERVVRNEYPKLVAKLGCPMLKSGPRTGEEAGFAVVAMGKFGGRELNYHSDLDVIFLFEGEGRTVVDSTSSAPSVRAGSGTSNQHFFGELGQKIINAMGRVSEQGRLYEVDARLRPTGRNGPLAMPLEAFDRYFTEGEGPGALWERLALTRARAVFATPDMATKTRYSLDRAAFGFAWSPEYSSEIQKMRGRLEKTATKKGDFKRGPGGIVDIEFIVQLLQLRRGAGTQEIRLQNTLDSLESLREAGLLKADDAAFLESSYQFLRKLEGFLRLTNQGTTSCLPDDPTELTRLAHLMRLSSGGDLLVEFDRIRKDVRFRFERIFQENGAD
jgi:[glutamine synthetase] adenylyltransferase / [glutamine synthetase]-adenylyl-L-tyrosine phosphorylase